MNEREKLIEEQLKALTANLRRAIMAVPWKTLVQEIGKVNILDTGQIVSLEQEVMFVIYAFENPRDFVSNIVREVGLSEEVAHTIAESVANKILEPILGKSESDKNTAKTTTISAKVPEIAPVNLPMVEKGEVAHAVPHVEQIQTPAQKPEQPKPDIKPEHKKTPLPDYRYPDNKDPYREQLT